MSDGGPSEAPSWGDESAGESASWVDESESAEVDGGLDPDDVPEPPTTGDTTVDEALLRIAGAMTSPLPEQVQAYDGVHRALQDRLADVGD